MNCCLSLLSACSILAAASATPLPDGFVTSIPKPTDAVLFNPRMGLYMQYPPLDLPSDHWMLEIADIAYYRFDWSRLNPEENVYRFDEVFGPIFEKWVGQEKRRVAFRVMSSNMHSRLKYVTPKWVFDKGVPGVRHRSVYGKPQVDPVFWDDLYLDIQCRFIAALGRYLNGRKGLEFVDIGAIGEWGEMHLSRWTKAELEKTGFSHTRYVLAYRRIIDAYVQAFPDTLVFLNVGGPENWTINDYAAMHGVHFRQDGLKPSGASYNVGEWLYKPYAERGVLCNFEFHSGYRAMVRKGWDLRKTIDAALAAPISYLNTNLGAFGPDVPPVVREELTRAGRRIGYRLLPIRIEHPARFHVRPDAPSRLPLISVWRNDGVAAPTLSFAIEWSLADSAGMIAASTLVFPKTPTTHWRPGAEIETAAGLDVPPGLPPGPCTLLVGMVLPENGERIRLGLEGRRADGRYPAAALSAVPTPKDAAASKVIYSEDFENGLGGWKAATAGIRLERVPTPDGNGQCLRVFGHKDVAWNYAGCSVPGTLRPFIRVRLTARMRVNNISRPGLPPYLKIGVHDADGKWITNLTTDRYDTRKPGTWQELETTADLPAGAVRLQIAVETGSRESPIDVDLLLDDVRLEILASW